MPVAVQVAAPVAVPVRAPVAAPAAANAGRAGSASVRAPSRGRRLQIDEPRAQSLSTDSAAARWTNSSTQELADVHRRVDVLGTLVRELTHAVHDFSTEYRRDREARAEAELERHDGLVDDLAKLLQHVDESNDDVRSSVNALQKQVEVLARGLADSEPGSPAGE